MKLLIHSSNFENVLGDLVGNWRPSGKYSSQFFYDSHELKFDLSPDGFLDTLKEFEDLFGYAPSIECFFEYLKADDDKWITETLRLNRRLRSLVEGPSPTANFSFWVSCLPNTEELFDLLSNRRDGGFLSFPTVSVAWQSDGFYRIGFSMPEDRDTRKHLKDQKELKRILTCINGIAEKYLKQGWNLQNRNKRGSAYDVWQMFSSIESTVLSLRSLIDEFVGCLSGKWIMAPIGSGDQASVLEFCKLFADEPIFVKAEPCLFGTLSMYDRRRAFESFRRFRIKSFEIPIAVVNDRQREIWFGLRFDGGRTLGVAYGSSAKDAKTEEIVRTYFPDSRIEVVEK